MAPLFQRSMMAVMAASVLALMPLGPAACGDGVIEPGHRGGTDDTTETPQVDAGTGALDGPAWANAQHDGGTLATPLTPNSVTVNVGINRGVVAGYPGDACGSISRFLVLDVTGPSGALQHVDLDCQQGGNGWTYFSMPAGHYTATLQLFDEDAYGKRVAATPVRTASGELKAGQGALIWVDYTYADFATAYEGNLRWKVAWVSDGAAHGCKDASPQVVAERLTVHDAAGQVVSARTVSPAGGWLVTDGSAAGACSDYGSSDAEMLPSVSWGVYTVKIEGLTGDGQAAYCVQRQLFSTKGDSIIYPLLAPAGGC
jgi:hypothetical protein